VQAQAGLRTRLHLALSAAGLTRFPTAVEHPLLLMEHGVDAHLIHEPERQRDARDALPDRFALLRLHATGRLLAREQLELDGNLAEEPILRVHPVRQYTSMFPVS
jgi:hypothetical protein